ncbi:MAG: hypothetical protein EG826_13715 [Deltaproteobacteria bacterium]|nr:hypothetical protein [Deltaproteobacteria bacterium]
MQEILVVAAVVVAIFLLPRLFGKKSAPETPPPGRSLAPPPLTGRIRLAILITVLWVAGWAAVLKPWEGNRFLFICLTLGPILLIWGGVWVWFGFRKYRR